MKYMLQNGHWVMDYEITRIDVTSWIINNFTWSYKDLKIRVPVIKSKLRCFFLVKQEILMSLQQICNGIFMKNLHGV